MTTELEQFYDAIESIDTAMMTTRRADGHFRARERLCAREAAAFHR